MSVQDLATAIFSLVIQMTLTPPAIGVDEPAPPLETIPVPGERGVDYIQQNVVEKSLKRRN